MRLVEEVLLDGELVGEPLSQGRRGKTVAPVNGRVIFLVDEYVLRELARRAVRGKTHRVKLGPIHVRFVGGSGVPQQGEEADIFLNHHWVTKPSGVK